MKMSDLFARPGGWLSTDDDHAIVISSRIRLARNLDQLAFPGWGGKEECIEIWNRLRPLLCEKVPALQPALCTGMEDVEPLDKQILLERHLISREQMEKGAGSGLILHAGETLSVMVNEEDHLRLQCLRSGLDLAGAWAVVNQLDTEIEQVVDYAFSPELGYLTSCPTNVGTGMRASVMLHLPGLTMMEELGPIVKGLGKIGLVVRGLWGEGTESAGNMVQISNQMTLGEREPDVVANIEQIAREIIEHERNARARLMEKRQSFLEDQVGRAYGILSHARLLSSKEALDLLSGLRLGVDLGIVKKVKRAVLDELVMNVQPGHLQKFHERLLKPKERDRYRADLVRKTLNPPPSRTRRQESPS
ncbi:MAG TPA: protein arginine kinase [Kiritimatiellia bacterium]|nr:protein arginine kinase [Kiritimatiellia bacterium]